MASGLPVEFLATTRLGEKGQLTIPKEYRRALALEASAPIAVLQVGNGLLLIPEQVRFRELCDRIASAFGRRGMTAAEVSASLPATRELVFARLYPKLAKRRRTARAKTRRG